MEGESRTSFSDHKRRQPDRKDRICQKFSLINPAFEFLTGETLFLFDEIQDCINCATSLKAFKADGRFDFRAGVEDIFRYI